ncbi:hypothetical protein SERLADRAFT_437786, partial [Serpula lacrymans var. lacrymans S7.9]
YALSAHPTLSTPSSLAAHLSHFGPIDAKTVVLALKPAKPKKKSKSQTSSDEASKNVTALVPFSQLSAAYAAVCASGRDRLCDMGVSWAGGEEPLIIGWLRKKGKLGDGAGTRVDDESMRETSSERPIPPKSPGSPPSLPSDSNNSAYASFPSTFPSFSTTAEPSPSNAANGSGLDYESLTLLRMREAERARLEREILEAEAGE